jgi:putative protein-disulfide isomerase
VLADVASRALAGQGFSVTPEQVLADWEDAGAIALTASEFKAVRRRGISSFPTLLLEHEGEVSVLAPGYMSVDELDARLGNLIKSG